jgi:cobalamin biosynthesis Mg chelatase CobN
VNKPLTYVLTALMAGLVLMLGAPAASAHGGAIKLEVTGDGADNVNVLVTYKKDGHPVTEILDATLTATSTDGRSFGPVPLRSAPEGQNLYHSAEPLPSGEWQVKVTATEPAKAHATVKVKAGDIAASPVAATGPAPGQATAPGQNKAAATSTAADDEGAMGMPVKIGIIALVALLAVAAWLGLAWRNRASARR